MAVTYRLGQLEHDRIGTTFVHTESRMVGIYHDHTVEIEFTTRVWDARPSHSATFRYSNITFDDARKIHRFVLDEIKTNPDEINMLRVHEFILECRNNFMRDEIAKAEG